MEKPTAIPPQPVEAEHEHGPTETSPDALTARFWTPEHLACLTAGRWVSEPAGDLDLPLTGMCIDSRTLRRGDVFLAIHGERFDGHDFVSAAFEAGAAMAIVEKVADFRIATSADPKSEIRNANSPAILRVDNAVAALHAIARAWRDVLRTAGCRVIAVAGSNGKTTTRHLIHAALEGGNVSSGTERASSGGNRSSSGNSKLTGTQSPRSFNNHLGVPLTLLAARVEHDFVVAEIGTNHPGEIAALAAMAQPDAAVITSIGREHLEYFGSVEGVAREEGALLEHVASGGLVAAEVEAWQQITAVMKTPKHLRVIRFGATGDADVWHERLTESPAGLTFEMSDESLLASDTDSPAPQSKSNIRNATFHLPLLGRHNASNALVAVVIGRWMGVSMDQLARQLAGVEARPGRLEVRRIGSLLVLHDAYNANPDSMAAAIETLAGMDVSSPDFQVSSASSQGPRDTDLRPRRIAILGDMGELGSAGPDAHRQLGNEIAAHGDAIDRVVLVGRLTLFTAETLGRHWTNDRVHVVGPLNDAAIDRIVNMLQGGDVVLLKASRAVALERLLPTLEKRFTQ